MHTSAGREQPWALAERHAERKEWAQVSEICERVIYGSGGLPDEERARWMWRWACWMFQESRLTGRDLNHARALLHDAIPLAKNDPLLLGRILVDMTGMLSGADVQSAATRLRPLIRKCPQLVQFRGQVLYNLGYSHSRRGRMDLAARYYKQAAPLLRGHHQGWCYHNLAEAYAELGRYRAAAKTADIAAPLLAPGDRHMHASLQAYLAMVRGEVTNALTMIDDALADPQCPPLARANLWYYETLAYVQLREYDRAEERIDRTWRYASELKVLWVCDRLVKVRAELDAQRGVS